MRVSQHTGVKDTIMWKECVVKKTEVPGLEQASLISYALLACARSVIQNNKQVFISVIIRCQIIKIIVCWSKKVAQILSSSLCYLKTQTPDRNEPNLEIN